MTDKTRTITGIKSALPSSVRVPNLYLPMGDGAVNTTTETMTPYQLDLATSITDVLTGAGVLGAEWSADPGWLKGQDTDYHFKSATGASWINTLLEDRGYLIAWGMVKCSTLNTNPTSFFFQIKDSTNACIFRLGYATGTNKLRLQYRGSGSSGVVTQDMGTTLVNDQERFFLLAIDFDGTTNAIKIWDADPGDEAPVNINEYSWNAQETNKPDFSSYSDLVFLFQSDLTTTGNESSMRRFGFLQFGSILNGPVNFTNLLVELWRNRGIPGQQLGKM